VLKTQICFTRPAQL